MMEKRDGFFTWLKNEITRMVENTGWPVVIMGHSMGNKVIRYFMNWVVANEKDGEEWCRTNIHTWISVAAPFLGSPMAVKALVRTCFCPSPPPCLL